MFTSLLILSYFENSKQLEVFTIKIKDLCSNLIYIKQQMDDGIEQFDDMKILYEDKSSHESEIEILKQYANKSPQFKNIITSLGMEFERLLQQKTKFMKKKIYLIIGLIKLLKHDKLSKK